MLATTAEIAGFKKQLKVHKSEPTVVLNVLRALAETTIGVDVLRSTKINIAVQRFRKHTDGSISEVANQLLKTWREAWAAVATASSAVALAKRAVKPYEVMSTTATAPSLAGSQSGCVGQATLPGRVVLTQLRCVCSNCYSYVTCPLCVAGRKEAGRENIEKRFARGRGLLMHLNSKHAALDHAQLVAAIQEADLSVTHEEAGKQALDPGLQVGGAGHHLSSRSTTTNCFAASTTVFATRLPRLLTVKFTSPPHTHTCSLWRTCTQNTHTHIRTARPHTRHSPHSRRRGTATSVPWSGC